MCKQNTDPAVTMSLNLHFSVSEMTLSVSLLINEVLPLTARGIRDSQVTDGAVTETDDSRRWGQRMEKDGCITLRHQH